MDKINLEKSELIDVFKKMSIIRNFEMVLEEAFKQGDLFGTIHSCVGQEAVAVGIINNIDENDIITGNHRSHGHYLAYSNDIRGLMAELMGKASGVVNGRGGSQHIYYKNFYSNGVQGAMVPVAVGMALAEKKKKSNSIVLCFIGDGTLGQGVVYESMNMASLWELPVIFIVEDNHYAMSTHRNLAVAGGIEDRGKAFGLNTAFFTADELIFDKKKIKNIIEKVRNSSRSFLLHVETYRLSGHSKSDNRSYRTTEEEDLYSKKDPYNIIAKLISTDLATEIETDIHDSISKIYYDLKDAPNAVNYM